MKSVRKEPSRRGRGGYMLFRVVYEDEDEEDMKISELQSILMPHTAAAEQQRDHAMTGDNTRHLAS